MTRSKLQKEIETEEDAGSKTGGNNPYFVITFKVFFVMPNSKDARKKFEGSNNVPVTISAV